MKIVDVCEFYSPTGGGVRRYINQKLEFAPRFGHDLTIIAPGTENRRETVKGGTIIWVKSPQLPFDPNYRMFWRARDVWRVLDELKPDLVEGSSPWRGGWLTARWHSKVPKAFFMHMDPVAVYPQTFLGNLLGEERVDRMFGWFWTYLNRLNNFYDAAIVTNPAMAQRFGKFGLKNIEVAPFGVEREKFSPLFADAAMRRDMQCHERQAGPGHDMAGPTQPHRHHAGHDDQGNGKEAGGGQQVEIGNGRLAAEGFCGDALQDVHVEIGVGRKYPGTIAPVIGQRAQNQRCHTAGDECGQQRNANARYNRQPAEQAQGHQRGLVAAFKRQAAQQTRHCQPRCRGGADGSRKPQREKRG